MNNRILATLFALAIALFIGVAPVKAEAATTCQHKNTKYVCDDSGHTVVCKSCGTVLFGAESHDDWSYVQSSNGKHVKTCATCGHKVTEEHTAWGFGADCRCKYCSALVDHQMETACNGTEHWQKCTICDKATVHEEHNFTVTKNGDGKHTQTCSVCETVKTSACKDSKTDTDCVCDTCGEAVANADHKLVEVAGVAATCTEPGVSRHRKCEYCGKLFSVSVSGKVLTEEDIVIEATDHAPYSTWDKSDATYHWHNCGNGDCEEQIDKAEHTFKWSYDANGHYQYCEVCEYVKVVYEEHELVRVSVGDDKHETKCNTCGYVMGTYDCTDVDTDKDCVCDHCGGTMDHSKMNLTNTNRFTVVHKTATCTEDGIWLHYQCNNCGLRIRESNGKYTILDETTMVNPKTGHKAGSVIHKDDETHYYLCINDPKNTGKICGAKVNVEDHKLEYKPNGPETHYAKCTVCEKIPEDLAFVDHVDANKDCVCDVCGYEHVHVRADMTHHARKEATCLKDGNKSYFTCNTCGGIFTGSEAEGFTPYEGDYVLKALGHDWAFKGKANGLHWATCKRDGCTVTDNLPHTDTDGDCLCDLDNCGELVHSHKLIHVDEVPASCGQAGSEEYYKYEGCGKMFDMNQNPISAPVEIPALNHVAGEDYEAIEGDMHAIKCVKCGEVMTTEAHDDDNKDNRCDVCNIELALEYVEQQDPTCTGIGYKGYWVSKYTGRKYADANGNQYITAPEQIPALGHSWDSSNGASHVCGRCGHTEAHVNNDENKHVCDTCLLPVPGHDITIVDEVAATCTKSGKKAYVKCECGDMYDLETGAKITTAIVIPSAGHKLASTVVNDTTTGEHYGVCTVCGKKVYSEHETVLEDPLKGNYHQWICECGYSDTEKHTDTDGDNKCDECKHDMANTAVNVEQHDSVTVITGEKKTVDNSKSWLWNWIDKLLPGTSGGTSTSKTTTSASASASASNENTATSGTGTNASTGSTTSAPSGSGSASGSTSTNTGSTGTGIINEFIQWLSQLFNVFLQSK